MGITGLIPFLEKASAKCNIKQFKGKSVAIDTYCWLHKGAFACAEKLARGEETDIHIQYCLKYVNMLLSNDIKPILVFDGRHLPAKANTELKRREGRQNSKKKAAELLRLGKIDEARSHLRRCVDITHEMALQLIQECRKKNVDCIVAPYEADAQMAYLNKKGIAQYVITEDSDLVLFGCNRILFKLDLSGNCLLVESDKLYLAMGCKEEKYQFEKFRQMCILSGCDYLDSLPGIGLAKACKFILKTEDADVKRALGRIPAYLNMRNLVVSDEYKTDFLKAQATFQHMVVYDPIMRKMVRLNDPQETGTDEELCSNAGEFIEDEIALHLALGNLNPFNLKRLDNWTPEGKTLKGNSIWMPSYKPPISVKKAVPIQKIMSKKTENNSEIIFDDEEEDNIGGNILASYLAATEDKNEEISPPGKRRFSNIDKTPKKQSKNPFAISDAVKQERILMSPTKLTPCNTSLIKNFSPVKKIQYKKTVVSNEKKVISRFFGASKPEFNEELKIDEKILKFENPMMTNFDSPDKKMADCESKTKYDSSLIEFLNSPDAKIGDRGERTPTKIQPISEDGRSFTSKPVFSLDSGISDTCNSSEKEDTSEASTSQPITRFSLDTFKYSSPKKIGDKITPIKETTNIIDDDDVIEIIESPARKIPKKSEEQPKAVKVRRIGLPKIKSGTIGAGQTKLSMFGFQKKAQI